jgi:hypothetical protein
MWNCQRDHSDNGKFMRIFPGRYRTATQPLEIDEDYEVRHYMLVKYLLYKHNT